MHEAAQTQGRPQVISKHEKGRTIGTQAAQRHAIQRCGHAMLANAEVHVASAKSWLLKSLWPSSNVIVLGAKSAEPPINQGKLGANMLSTLPLLTRVAKPFGSAGNSVMLLSQPCGKLPRTSASSCCASVGNSLLYLAKFVIPALLAVRSRLPMVSAKYLGTSSGTKNLLVCRPAVGLLGQPDFVVAQRCTVGTMRIGFIGRAVTDDAANDDQRRLVLHSSKAVRAAAEGLRVIGVGNANDIPAESFKTPLDVFAECKIR